MTAADGVVRTEAGGLKKFYVDAGSKAAFNRLVTTTSPLSRLDYAPHP